MRITKLAITGLWSFGDAEVQFDNLGDHNIIIGKNNAGKSKVLAAIRWLQENYQGFRSLDISLKPDVVFDPGHSDRTAAPRYSIGTRVSDTTKAEVLERIATILKSEPAQLTSLFASHWQGDGIWDFIPSGKGPMKGAFTAKSLANAEKLAVPNPSSQETAGRWRNALGHLRLQLAEELVSRIQYIGGWRALRQPVEKDKGIIQQLHLWRDPPQDQKQLIRTFEDVQSLFRELMLDTTLELRPEHSGQNLSVMTEGRYLPIESLGDGVQHLLMLAYHLTVAPGSIFLIEEPETHLHPELQRNFLRILRERLRGQAFITTHSPVLLDAGLSSNVYRIEHDRHRTTATHCSCAKDLCQVLDVLDVRASDLLQANLVIWVEGPTDRMFLKRCFELREDAFVEGIDYQIVYYGGKLRAHLSFDDLLSEFVNLLKLSRNVVMLCDSDRDSEASPLDHSKERLHEECERVGGLYWITDGREIENYFPDEVLTAAYRELLSDDQIAINVPRFERLSDVLAHCFPNPKRGEGWKVQYDDNKTRIMPLILKHFARAQLDRWGLSQRLNLLAERIRRANTAR
jgi:predicted ATPase